MGAERTQPTPANGPPTRRALSFKSDAEFLAYISMGAAGVRAVVDHLRAQGHRPLVLERGSDDFKLWKSTRIKGWRVPDVLCIDDAKRVEVRAKSDFKISGSHSTGRAERHWSYGLADDDYMAFPVCRLAGERITDWKVVSIIQYARVGNLRTAFEHGLANVTQAKAGSQGAEKQVVWPTIVAGGPGTVIRADEASIQYRRASDERPISFRLKRKRNLVLQAQVSVGDRVVEHQVLAGVVPVVQQVPLGAAVGEAHYVGELHSSNERIRFAAAKALSSFGGEAVDTALAERIIDRGEHVFLRLEAAAGLARHGGKAGWQLLEDMLRDQFAENRLECCIVLAEVRAEPARRMLLSKLADESEHVDVRAGAAWALGEHRAADAFDALASAFSARAREIRVEAARALTKLARIHRAAAVDLFRRVPNAARPGVAFALRMGAGATVQDLRDAFEGEDARQWIAYVVGTGADVAEIEKLKERDTEVYFAATLLWKMLTTGVYHMEEYG